MGSEPLSRIEKILSNIVGEGSYELELPLSDAEEILQAILNDTTTDVAARDRMCEILLCILNNEEYTGETLSRAEEILKCISQGEKYEVDEWTYEHVLSRVEKLLTDWANKEDPEYTKTVSGILIHVLDAVEKPADSLIVSMSPKQEAEPWIDSAPDTEPYLSRIIPRGNRSSREFHGGTVAWNQIISASLLKSASGYGITITKNQDGTLTITGKSTYYGSIEISSYFRMEKDHIYFMYSKGLNDNIHMFDGYPADGYCKGNGLVLKWNRATGSASLYLRVVYDTECDNTIQPMLCDLTQMFANNPAIADYVYTLEQATAGAGVAWLKSHGFIDDEYHGYDLGSLKSVNISGLKIIDTDLTEHTYPLTSTDLRGLFMLDAQNNLYTDGDIYISDGTVTRKYVIVEYDGSSDESWLTEMIAPISEHNFFIATNPSGKRGVYSSNKFVSYTYTNPYVVQGKQNIFISVAHNLNYYPGQDFSSVANFRTWLASNPIQVMYELATPTTETALAYTNPQVIETGGTEEFVDSRDVKIPVGNSTIYFAEYEVEGYESVTVYHAQTQEEPNPTEYEVLFTQQGIVYMGVVDIVTGVLSVNMAEVDLGSLSWYSSSSKANTFYAAAPSDSKPATSSLTTRVIETQVVCDKYVQVPIYDLIYDASVKNKIAFCNLNGTGAGYQRLYVNNVMYSDAAVFKTAMNGTKCVYELAEPQTYQLTAQEVQMLLGENTLWTDDNLNLQLTYKGSNPAMMMQSLRAQNNILKKQGLKPIEEPLKPLDPVKPIIKK